MADQNVLQWQRNSTDETGFLVQRNPDANLNPVFGQVATVGAGVLTYTDLAVVENTNYCYQVAAFNGNGTSAFSNIACRTVPDVETPPAGSLIVAGQTPKRVVDTRIRPFAVRRG